MKLHEVDLLLHWRCPTPFFRTSGAERTFFWCPVWRSQRGEGSRRLCGRRRKPRLEPDIRSSRFVIVREIPNAPPLRVATFTRTTLRSRKCQTRRLSDFFPPARLFEEESTDELQLANVGSHPTSDTLVRFVPQDPLAAKHQTVLASNPNNRRMETLRVGDPHCKVSETSCNTSLYALESLSSKNQEARGSGGITPVASSENSFTSTSSSTASPCMV